MTRKTQLIGLAFLICTLLLCTYIFLHKGGKTRSPQVGDIAKTPTEQKKAKLLQRIHREFENPQPHFELGQLYQHNGLWAQADSEYVIALNFDPFHQQAQAARVRVLLEMSDNTKARLLADHHISQASTSAASLKLALAFQKQLLDEYVLSCYQQALRLAPNSAKINRQIGYYYLSKNDKDRARDYLMRSFTLNTNQPEVARELGRLGVPIEVPQKTE